MTQPPPASPPPPHLPPHDPSHPPTVHHLVVDAADSPPVADYVAAACAMPTTTARALIEFGAVYWCPVPPPAPQKHKGLSESTRDTLNAAHAAARAVHGRGCELWQPRRAGVRDVLPRGAYVRVHAAPKRFPAAAELTGAGWGGRIVATGPGWAVLDKPHGVPSVPTVDNGVEHAIAGAARGLAWLAEQAKVDPAVARPRTFDPVDDDDDPALKPRPAKAARRRRASGPAPVASGDAETHGLAAAHRLDQAASGLLTLAAARPFARAWGEAMAAGALAKCYRAVFSGDVPPPPLGRVTHWATSVPRGPGTPAHTRMAAEPTPGAARCDLVILSVRRIRLSDAAVTALTVDNSTPPSPTAHEASILLLTGRTHQVRAQMAALGCPLLGDALYGGGGGGSTRRPLDAPVALQAARLAALAGGPFGDADVAFTAGAPWWREEKKEENETDEFAGADAAWAAWMAEKAAAAGGEEEEEEAA